VDVLFLPDPRQSCTDWCTSTAASGTMPLCLQRCNASCPRLSCPSSSNSALAGTSPRRRIAINLSTCDQSIRVMHARDKAPGRRVQSAACRSICCQSGRDSYSVSRCTSLLIESFHSMRSWDVVHTNWRSSWPRPAPGRSVVQDWTRHSLSGSADTLPSHPKWHGPGSGSSKQPAPRPYRTFASSWAGAVSGSSRASATTSASGPRPRRVSFVFTGSAAVYAPAACAMDGPTWRSTLAMLTKAHLAREVHRLAGVTPTELLAETFVQDDPPASA